MKKIILFSIFLILIYFSIRDAVGFLKNIPVRQNPAEIFLVKRVVDGDTVELENGQKVRYLGINTPETVDPRKPVECFGREAKEANKKLVEGKIIRLEKDVSETDKYGRLLRYVYIDDLFINDDLVRRGFAQVSTYPPDVKYAGQFIESEKSARENKLGLWNSCLIYSK